MGGGCRGVARGYQLIVSEFGIRSVANDLEEMATQSNALYLVDVGVADVVGFRWFDAVREAEEASAGLRNLDALLQCLGPDLGELPGHANTAGVVLVVEDGRRILGWLRVCARVEPIRWYDEHRTDAEQVLKCAYRACVAVFEARYVQYEAVQVPLCVSRRRAAGRLRFVRVLVDELVAREIHEDVQGSVERLYLTVSDASEDLVDVDDVVETRVGPDVRLGVLKDNRAFLVGADTVPVTEEREHGADVRLPEAADRGDLTDLLVAASELE